LIHAYPHRTACRGDASARPRAHDDLGGSLMNGTICLIRLRRLCSIAAVALWLLPTSVSAQTLYGSVTGTVTDDSGGAVPGVTVTLSNESTGLQLDTVPDDQGLYTVRNLLPGTYTLRPAL